MLNRFLESIGKLNTNISAIFGLAVSALVIYNFVTGGTIIEFFGGVPKAKLSNMSAIVSVRHVAVKCGSGSCLASCSNANEVILGGGCFAMNGFGYLVNSYPQNDTGPSFEKYDQLKTHISKNSWYCYHNDERMTGNRDFFKELSAVAICGQKESLGKLLSGEVESYKDQD